MFQEPWSNILEYPDNVKEALKIELIKEVGSDKYKNNFSLLAKREDQDEILISSDSLYYIIHLTWSGRIEKEPCPRSQIFNSKEELKVQLAEDAKEYL